MYHFHTRCPGLLHEKQVKTVSQKIFNDIILRFGFPLRIHHDQRREFENSLHRAQKKLCGVKHSRTIPYHPQGNGQVEACNHENPSRKKGRRAMRKV